MAAVQRVNSQSSRRYRVAPSTGPQPGNPPASIPIRPVGHNIGDLNGTTNSAVGGLSAPPQAQARIGISAYVLWVGLFLGYCTDLFFYNQELGISVPIFTLLLLGALFALSRRQGVQIAYRNVVLLVPPILFFSAMVFVRANATLTLLNIVAVVVLFCLIAFFFAEGHLERLGVLGYFVTVGQAAGNILTRPAPVVSQFAHEAATHKNRYRLAGPLLRGILLAIPVLLIFTALLYSADSIFAGVIDKGLRLNFLDGAPELMWRIILALSAAWVVSGFLYLALARTHPRGGQRGTTTPLSPDTQAPAVNIHLGFLEGTVVLTLVNALFLGFAYIQVVYLFSGQALQTLNYEAYREYVRSGFGQLLAAAVLTMALIVGMRRLIWKETAREIHLFNILSSLMIVLTMIMLVSAFWRMLVWESVEFYINTQTRIYVRWFIIWLGVAFLWLFGTIWLRPNRFAIGAYAATIGFLATVNIANPDADVASRNLARQDELSIRYLYLLSEDAVPALARGLGQTTGYVNSAIRAELSARLYRLEHTPQTQTWPSFHLARADAYQILTELKKAGKID